MVDMQTITTGTIDVSNSIDTPLEYTIGVVRTAARVAATEASPVRDLLAHARVEGMISLAGGLPSAEGFDITGMADAVSHAMVDARQTLQYGLTEGEPHLRQSLVQLMHERGLTASAEAILVTTGSQQAIDLVARLLVDPHDVVIVLRPSYLAAVSVFRLLTDRLIGVDSDEQGPDLAALEALIEAGHRPKAIYLVPDFANPTGLTMSAMRRREVLDWAVRHEVVIIEDDPYGQLRFAGQAQASLFAIAQDDPRARPWVIYISSLSKIVAPGLRLGWIVLPQALIRPAVVLKQAMDLHTATITQTAASHYLNSGRLASRLVWLREHYRERKEALSAALKSELGEALSFNDPHGGMFLWARLRPAVTGDFRAQDWLPLALREGVAFVPGGAFYDRLPDAFTLRLSFSSTRPEQMLVAAQRLRRALEQRPE